MRLLLLFLVTFITIPFANANDYFKFEFDYSSFRGDDGKAIIELYFSFNKRGLMYVKSGDQYESRTTINVEINDKKKR